MPRTTGYVGSIDQGTTGTRFALYDHAGNLAAYGYEEHHQIYPKPGWVEHDPIEIWQRTYKVIRDTLARRKISPKQVKAIGVANQRETAVMWKRKTGQPICNAIVWQCRRTAPLVDDLKARGLSKVIKEKTGLVPDAYFSGTKIQWMLDNVPGARELAQRGELLFGNIDTWIIWNLTGSHVTDYGNASRTMLFNINELRWDDELLEMIGSIPEAVLPEVRPSSDRDFYGHVDREILGSQIPVCGDLGDQQAALFGQAGFQPGEVKNTYGTGNFILMNTGNRVQVSRHGLLSTIAYRINNQPVAYALEGSIFITGAAVQWLRDRLKIIRSADETEKMALSVEDTGGVYFVPSFVGLGAPHWNMYARGMIVGLTMGTTTAHLARATLETECYQTRDVIDAMRADSGLGIERIKVDGGGSRNDFMMQFQADVLGIPVIRPRITETTSLGAAYAAGLATGFWEDQRELERKHRVERVFEPKISPRRREALYGGWRTAVECALMWGNRSLDRSDTTVVG